MTGLAFPILVPSLREEARFMTGSSKDRNPLLQGTTFKRLPCDFRSREPSHPRGCYPVWNGIPAMTNESATQNRPQAAPSTLAVWLLFAAIFAAVQIGSLFNPPLMDDVDSSHAEAAQHFSESSDWITARSFCSSRGWTASAGSICCCGLRQP